MPSITPPHYSHFDFRRQAPPETIPDSSDQSNTGYFKNERVFEMNESQEMRRIGAELSREREKVRSRENLLAKREEAYQSLEEDLQKSQAEFRRVCHHFNGTIDDYLALKQKHETLGTKYAQLEIENRLLRHEVESISSSVSAVEDRMHEQNVESMELKMRNAELKERNAYLEKELERMRRDKDMTKKTSVSSSNNGSQHLSETYTPTGPRPSKHLFHFAQSTAASRAKSVSLSPQEAERIFVSSTSSGGEQQRPHSAANVRKISRGSDTPSEPVTITQQDQQRSHSAAHARNSSYGSISTTTSVTNKQGHRSRSAAHDIRISQGSFSSTERLISQHQRRPEKNAQNDPELISIAGTPDVSFNDSRGSSPIEDSFSSSVRGLPKRTLTPQLRQTIRHAIFRSPPLVAPTTNDLLTGSVLVATSARQHQPSALMPLRASSGSQARDKKSMSSNGSLRLSGEKVYARKTTGGLLTRESRRDSEKNKKRSMNATVEDEKENESEGESEDWFGGPKVQETGIRSQAFV